MSSIPIIEVHLPEKRRYETFLQGVINYSRQHEKWLIRHLPGGIDIQPRFAGCDGLIANAASLEKVPLSAITKPCVTYGYSQRSIPNVCFEERYIGERAAEIFVERGFSRFAFLSCAWPEACLRQEGFIRQLNELGHQVILLPAEASNNEPYRARIMELAKRLEPLQKPIAILAPDDHSAEHILDACVLAGINVPDEISVIGVDDNPFVSMAATPSLSSLDNNMLKLGLESARLLHAQLQGHKPQSEVVRSCIFHSRESTDTIASDDRVMTDLLTYIRSNGAENVDVTSLVNRSGISRRMLEYRFRKAFGISPKRFLEERRFQRACQLLENTDDCLNVIAEASGFGEAAALCRIIKRRTGLTPVKYRVNRAEIRSVN